MAGPWLLQDIAGVFSMETEDCWLSHAFRFDVSNFFGRLLRLLEFSFVLEHMYTCLI